MRNLKCSRRVFKCLSLCAAIVAALAPLPPAVSADDAPEVFARGYGSRAAGMGNSFVSIANDASAVFWNPAGAGWIPRKTITFSLTDIYFADVDYSSVSYVHPVPGAGAIGLSLTRWNVDGIEKRDENNVVTGGLTDTQMEMIASYSTPPVWNLTAAFGVKLDSQAMDGERALGVGADLGLLYRRARPGGRSFSAGVSLRNVVEPVLDLRRERTCFPRAAVFSACYGGVVSRYIDDWRFIVDLNAPSEHRGSANLGIEATVRPVSFRAGSLDGRLTAGVGTLWQGLAFDYAYSDEDYGRLHTFSLSVSFGALAPALVSGPGISEDEIAER
jgi:hypothetical protein